MNTTSTITTKAEARIIEERLEAAAAALGLPLEEVASRLWLSQLAREEKADPSPAWAKVGARRPVYIAAPYAHPLPAVRAWNVARACLLARLAVVTGSAPIVVHPCIAPVYGEEETEELRATGLEVDLALVDCVKRAGGSLWVLTLEDHTLSPGVRAEWRAWFRGQRLSEGLGPFLDTTMAARWDGWQKPMEAAGLLQQWEALRARPGVPHG